MHGATGFNEVQGSGHVAGDEDLVGLERACDVGLGCKVEDPGDIMLPEEGGDEGLVSDIPLHEGKARILVRADQVAAISRVGQLVEDDQLLQAFRQKEMADQGGPDESGTAGEKDGAELAHGRGDYTGRSVGVQPE